MNAPINKPEENALVAAAPRQQFDLSPQNFEQALTFSDYLADSDLVPKDFKGKPGNCLIAMQWGSELGLKPLQALQNLAIINGRPSLWGDAVIALVRGSPLCESIIETDDGHTAKCTVKRRGEPEQTRTFSMDDAKAAGLAGKQGPWTQYPRRMRQMRARAFALRDVFPDVLRGLPVAEELMDTPAERFMGPAEVVQPAAPPASYPDDQFKANLVKWREVISSKRKTADELIAWVEAKGAPLTDAQKEELKAPAVTFTYAQIAERINGAQNIDELNEAAALIPAIAIGEQRGELQALYVTRAEEFNA